MGGTVTTISLSDADVAEKFREYRDEKIADTSTAALSELLQKKDN